MVAAQRLLRPHAEGEPSDLADAVALGVAALATAGLGGVSLSACCVRSNDTNKVRCSLADQASGFHHSKQK